MDHRLKVVPPIMIALVFLIASACDGDHPPAPTTPAVTATSTPKSSSTGTSTPTPHGSGTVTPAPEPSPSATRAGIWYVVQSGDTLFGIAARFGISAAAIAAANDISDPSLVYPGQYLFIPGAVVVPSPAPKSSPGGPATTIWQGNVARNRVAFTFDAGSDAGYTSMILDTLAANDIQASFGVTGAWAERFPDLLKRIVREGHTLINHSYDHSSFTGQSTQQAPLTRAERWQQLDRTEEIVEELTGATTKPFFRPPFGDHDQSVSEDVGARGYQYIVMWNADSRGWTGIPAFQINQRCLDLAAPGAIYVFHVGAASEDGPALQSIIDSLRDLGYSIGDLDYVLAP